jgi:hypothetical protein
MIQPHLLTCLTQQFGGKLKDRKKFLTPGTLRCKVQKSIHLININRRSIGLVLGCCCTWLYTHVQVLVALSGSAQSVLIQQLGVPIISFYV